MKPFLTLILVTFFLQVCAQKQSVILQLGTVVSYAKDGQATVSGSTNLTAKDTLSLILSSPRPFNTPSILFTVFKVVNGKQQALSYDAIQLKSGMKVIRHRFPATDLIRRYGSGDFLLQFTHEKHLIAKGSFTIRTS